MYPPEWNTKMPLGTTAEPGSVLAAARRWQQHWGASSSTSASMSSSTGASMSTVAAPHRNVPFAAMNPTARLPPRRRWRDYRTPSGRSPVGDFIRSLTDDDAAAVLAGMSEVRDKGLLAARHLDGDIWEVRIDGYRVTYRVLFAEEGTRGRVLLALEAFSKKTQKTPSATIALAKRRLGDWRRRGDAQRPTQGEPPRRR